MNRVGLGLAVGAGYLLGRSKKMKLALAVGSMVAGKKLNLTPRGVADLVSQQLKDNPQFKEITEQLRGELRGVGKAASGAMVERQMSALADRLHSRTNRVRDELDGVVPDVPGGKSRDEADDEDEYEEPESARDEDEGEDYDEDAEDRADEGDEDEDAEDRADEAEEEPEEEEPEEEEPEEEEPPRKKATAKKTAAKKAPAKKAPAKKTAAKKAPAKKASARGAASQKTAGSARKTAAKTTSRTRRSKGGGE
ncbi:DNA primase [Streptomyces sp. NPDC017202]|uniref:DNA primase n=1 Tax=Streptomyces sp. NPDC017202 TaxID=3364981 RepID=UPI00378ED165